MSELLQGLSLLRQIFRRPETDYFEEYLRTILVTKGKIRNECFLGVMEDLTLTNQLPAIALWPELPGK